MYLENDNFLTELTKLFQKSKSSGCGTVRITMKRYDGQDRHRPRRNRKPRGGGTGTGSPSAASSAGGDAAETSCLIRATLNNRKLSTAVHQKDVNRFQLAFSSLLKGNIDGLKKRDKKAAAAAAAASAAAAAATATAVKAKSKA